MKTCGRVLVRWLATLAILGLVFWLVDVGAILVQLSSVDLTWLLLALAITPLQVVVSAWRWRYTVAKLGERLPLGHAVREYYLGTLVNQLVPGGVVGDAGRALRHRQNTGQTATAIHGVMIERLSGQLILLLLAVLLITLWLPLPTPPMPGLFLIPGVLVAALLVWSLLQASPVRFWWRRFRNDLWRALLAPAVLPVQLGSSLVVIGSYLLVFWCLAMGIGLEIAQSAPWLLMALCTVLLMAMVVPLTISGWGVREGAAALIWPLAGLDPEQGVALAVSYGLLVLLSALPGALFLFSGRKNPGQTAYRCPD
ncbi:lysylphosphatidylglycerol synthase transmembrane domain-containing protein [Marinobacter sp. LN3S78]|uniref:lysylphosphatidylglycerol synthase transmembrane domain-containing protein n=1 Tax=Marinobacter sp. LN3S78 TaxID=3382300 RepID=UPI00387AD26E